MSIRSPMARSFTPEQRRNLSEKLTGLKQSPETIAKRVEKLRGQKRSPEIRAKFSQIQQRMADEAIATNGYRISPEQRAKISKTLTGRKLPAQHRAKLQKKDNPMLYRPSDEHFEKLSALLKGKPFSGGNLKGSDHPGYIDGRSKERMASRMSADYYHWRKAVLTRDNWTCQECGAKGVKMTVHHIKSWAKFPDLRYALSNGISLCEPCHAEIDPLFKKWYLARLRKQSTNGLPINTQVVDTD